MSKEEGKVKWYLNPISVVLLLFFVLGPFGLPLLYRKGNEFHTETLHRRWTGKESQGGAGQWFKPSYLGG
ncbi:MAG: hypothetical protein WCO26_01170 [Deltaproteobacteria bacterium]